MAQLGLWLASWLGRIAAFPSVSRREKLPFVPMLLVVRGKWELFLGIGNDDTIDVMGSVKIGDTATLIGAYQLLAGLRLLVEWMAGTFRDWVTSIVGSE